MDGSMSAEELSKLSYYDLLTLAGNLEVVDNGFEDRDDLIERISLTHRKRQRNSYRTSDKFSEVQQDINAKCDALIDILESLYATFVQIPTGPLSEVLLKERLLKNPNLLLELQARKRAIEEKEPLIIIAGETNGGKSSFLNVILGVKILPTDVLHCTIAICKIKYSTTYSIETLDHDDQSQFFTFDGWQAAHAKLKLIVAQEDTKTREKGSAYKEITLKMPSPILKSGVTLVDTPGIGETTQMDSVTLDYIRSTRASAFIYVIKSDAAGGVQEDRLISFLRAIQDDYRNDSVEGAIDPRSALFICNRWDAISEEGVEKVKKNALTRLDIVWPGFQKEQVYFFSSKKTQLHLDADPDFVTEKLNDLMIGLQKLFNRAANNNIQHQYRWAKYFMHPASSHLSSMINHCISTNEELEDDFRAVASKQETLMKDSKEDTLHLQDTLDVYKENLRDKVCFILSDIKACDMEDYQQLISLCSGPKFLEDSKNRQTVAQWIVSSIINYCDKAIQESGILADMETDTKNKIKQHMGLFEEQVKSITVLVKGNSDQRGDGCLSSSCRSLASLSLSVNSFDIDGENFIGFTQLDHAVGNFLGKKKKSSGVLKSLPKVKSKIMRTVGLGTTDASKDYKHPSVYIEYCTKKNASLMKDDDEIIEGFVSGYLRIVKMYIQSAVERIPQFIEVNNELMDNIREHRKAFQEDKLKMRDVMVALEPCREQLQGYGLLYMEDLNADSVVFNSKRTSMVLSTVIMGDSARPSDSGFLGSGSTRNRVRGFWVQLRNAVIRIDDEPDHVTIKTYTCHMEKSHQLREIASLRCLEHINLAEFFGMSRIDINSANSIDVEPDSCEKVSAFIFKGTLISARIFKSNKLIIFRDFVKNFLHGLLSGLEFIHRENMVHMELNLDTVMVNHETGVVQLCQQCLPREIQLPEDQSIATKASVCLSPSVLQGDEYGICDDIYAFGLLLWELVFPDNPPYQEQRQWPLSRFIAEVFPSKMLGPEITKLPASDAVIKVLQGSLISGKGKICMAMTEIKSFMSEVKKDPIINGHNSRRTAVKHKSLDENEQQENSQPQRPPRKGDAKRLQSTANSSIGMPNQSDTQDSESLQEMNETFPIRKSKIPNNHDQKQNKHNRQRKCSMPLIQYTAPEHNGYQQRRLSVPIIVPNIKVTGPCEGEDNVQQLTGRESMNKSDSTLKHRRLDDDRMEKIWEKHGPLRKQGHVGKDGMRKTSSGLRGTYSIPDNLNKLSQSDCNKKSLFTQVRNKFPDSNNGHRSGSPARIGRRVKMLSLDDSATSEESTEDCPSFPGQTERRGKMLSQEDSSMSEDHEDCLHIPTTFSIGGTQRRSWHNERPGRFGKTTTLNPLCELQKSSSSTTLSSMDTFIDPLKFTDTSLAFPSSNGNPQIGTKDNCFKEMLKGSSSGDSGSSGNSRNNNSFFSDCYQSSAYSSIRSYSSNTSDVAETNCSQKRKRYGTTLKADQSLNDSCSDLTSASALPSLGNLNDFATSNAFPSLSQCETSNMDEGRFPTQDTLPSFQMGPFNDYETNTTSNDSNIDLTSARALPSLGNLNDFATSNAFPSLSQCETSNMDEGRFPTQDALPSFEIGLFNDYETNTTFDNEAHSSTFNDDMPALDFSNLNFMNSQSASNRSSVISDDFEVFHF